MSKAAWDERVLRVVDHVHAHLDADLEPLELAGLAQFSPHHFHRIFRGFTGESLMGFVRRLRLERAAQRLRFGNSGVTAIAAASGYGSHEAFTRAFKARFLMSPAEYRRHRRLPAAEDAHFSLRDLPARACLTLRVVGPYEQVCEPAWAELMAWARSTGVLEYHQSSVGLVYDDPEVTAPKQLRYDCGLVLSVNAPSFALALQSGLGSKLVKRQISAGRYASATHHGPYDTIEETYFALLGQYLPQRGLELADEPIVEVYTRGPPDEEPRDYLTEICVRIT